MEVSSECDGNGNGCLSSIHLSFEDSDDERYAPAKLVTPSKPLKNLLIYVDVRAENENRSKAISKELERLGATIAEKITENVSHVVYKDGRKGTLSQLKKYPGIHFVSVLWVDSCKTTLSRVTESLFPAKFPSTVDTPLPIARAKRVKSLQPKTFEEDVNNSGKKEERRRKRLRKLNKLVDTPIDHIICLDSQEYIKSSDLYKLVATPRAVPDTPWILNYINGSQNDESPSQLGSCSKTNLDNSDMQGLSEEVQCKLNFEIDEDSRRASCIIPVGSSPTASSIIPEGSSPGGSCIVPVGLCQPESTQPLPQSSPQKTKKAFARRSSICRRSPRLSMNLRNVDSKNEYLLQSRQDSCKPYTKSVRESAKATQIAKTDITITLESTSLKDSEVNQSIPILNKLVTDNSKLASDNVVPVLKKKKRLMSKTKFCFPQEVLISPVMKSSTEIENIGKHNESKMENCKRMPRTVGHVHDAHTFINAVENSKKNVNKLKHKIVKFHDKMDENDVDRYIPARNPLPNANVETSIMLSAKEDSAVPIRILNSSKLKKCEVNVCDIDSSISIHPADFSSPNKIDEKVDICGRDLKLIKGNIENKANTDTLRKTATVSSRRSSGIDFKISKCYRKTPPTEDTKINTESKCVNLNSSTDIRTVRVPSTFSLVDQESSDLNASFVHDEDEGLICLPQQDTEEEEEGNSESLLLPGPLECDVEIENEEAEGINDDSGISDSEELADEVNENNLSNGCLIDDETIAISALQDTKSTCNRRSSAKTKRKPTHLETKEKVTKKVMNRTLVEKSSTKKISKPRCSIVTTSLHFSEQEYVKAMVKQLGGFNLRNNVSNDTTHIITGDKRRTLNILYGIIQGCWIVSPKWVADSVEEGHWLDEDCYEMRNEFPMGRVARIFRLRDGRCNHKTLLSKLPPVYLAEVTSPRHEEMMKLILSCGGKLTTSTRKAGIAIGLISCRRKDLRIVTEKWLLDSITNGRLMPTEAYLVTIRTREASPDF